MKLVKATREIKEQLKNKNNIGFVPTMGNLHKGHLSLVERACRENRCVVVSLFVNPTQFGPNEDFKKYPRTLEEDMEKLSEYHVDYIFHPSAGEMYINPTVYVNEDKLSSVLCGKYRPGHFKGVLTVVMKLFHIVNPEKAYFGRKDYQQYILIKKMTEDLNMDIGIVSCPIVREKDGLAISSRNSYLSNGERLKALEINRALIEVKRIFSEGERNSDALIQFALNCMPHVDVQYVEFVHPESLESQEEVTSETVMAIAGYVGKTRLIDNAVLGEENI